MLSSTLQTHLEALLGTSINVVTPVSGGDINAGYLLQTSADKFFLKVNSRTAFPGMFEREREGLETLAAANAIGVPDVILQTDADDESCLVLAWIETGEVSSKSSQQLGEQLANLHQSTQAYFGFHRDNYMGSLTQHNKFSANFPDFFITQRLQPMVAMAVDIGQLAAADAKRFELLYNKIPALSPQEPPALVHGDLWSGNYLIDTKGKPYLIDPAVSYSNREVDIALTTLFGGFAREFYQAYQSTRPMESGWQERLPLWNLYPLLVHVNLFGGSYVGQVRSVLNRFVD